MRCRAWVRALCAQSKPQISRVVVPRGELTRTCRPLLVGVSFQTQ